MPTALQGKLLRAIENKQVRRLGAVRPSHVDFRLISATNIDLENAVRNREFRLDLYHRLNVITLGIPPLRNRADEIQHLCEHFLTIYCEKYNRKKRFSERAMRQLERHDWPGNIRELRNLVERAVLMTDVEVEFLDELPDFCFYGNTRGVMGEAIVPEPPNRALIPDVNCNSPVFPMDFDPEKSFKEQVRNYEKWLANQAVKHCGSLEKAAGVMRIDKSTLIRKRK
jgi:transcriptional regulator with PAS, ATPase and Fis domain